MSLEATVIQHEDVVNSSGEIITKYIVKVKLASTVSYNISKRYSEFKTLFEIMKDVIPLDYKFPNKSLFHNSAQATKERRVRGFDQLLQILLSRKPVPMVIERFLGINERKSKALQIRAKSLTLKKNNSIPGAMNEMSEDGFGSTTARNSDGSESREGHSYEQTIVPEPQSNGKEITYSLEKYELIRSLRRETPYIITSSMKMTSLVYVALVVIRVIDISGSDFYEILVTMCVLSFVVAFVRINLMKYSIKQGDTVAQVEEAVPTASSVRIASPGKNTLSSPVMASAVVVASEVVDKIGAKAEAAATLAAAVVEETLRVAAETTAG